MWCRYRIGVARREVTTTFMYVRKIELTRGLTMKGERLGEFEELVLLCVWNLDGEATAVPIKESLESQASRSVSLGAIYAALDRLSRKGFVDSWIGGAEPIRGGRSKRFYRVTASAKSRAASADTRTALAPFTRATYSSVSIS